MRKNSRTLLFTFLFILFATDIFSQFSVVATYGSGITNQRWKRRETFPQEDIKKDWDDGFYLSHVSYNNDNWTIVSSKGLGYTQQAWRTRTEFPEKEISELWDDGYAITDLTYGNGVWALVMSKGSEYSGQKWSTRTESISERISELWEEGRSIIKIAYGQEKWAIVAAKTESFGLQRWRTSLSYPEDHIAEGKRDGYQITQLEYLNDRWVLLLTKYKDTRFQKTTTSDEYPTQEIRNFWDSNYYITSVGFKEEEYEEDWGLYLSNSTNKETTTTTTPETTTTYKAPPNSTDSRVTGTWSGKSMFDTETVEVTFADNNLFTMITSGEVVGGEAYEVEGVIVRITYELNMATTPHQIDVVFSVDNIESGRMKGIFELTGKNDMKLLLAEELDTERPRSFVDKSGPAVVILKKTNKK